MKSSRQEVRKKSLSSTWDRRGGGSGEEGEKGKERGEGEEKGGEGRGRERGREGEGKGGGEERGEKSRQNRTGVLTKK